MADYWKERELNHIENQIKNDAKLTKRIKKNQLQSMDNIQLQIDGFYGRYADAEGLTMAEARKRISQVEIDKYSAKANRYVRERDFSVSANAEMRLYNATMRINRLELLKANINLELVAMTNADEHFLLDSFTKGARSEYLRQSGILGETLFITKSTLQ